MIKKKVRFAVIGTNKITDRFLSAGEQCEDFVLTAVYSRSLERAREYGEKYGAKLAFDNLTELAACQEVDAVYIASPNCCHAAQSIQMLEQGKHVICEKPVASNARELESMIAEAEKNQVVLMEAMRSIYSPGFQEIGKALPKLGTIRWVSFRYCQYSSRYDNFKKGIIENAFKPELSNGALMDIGVYCVHPLAVLFGPPKNILSSCLRLSNGVDGGGTILAEYEGMQGELIYSKITDSKIPSEIQGESGTMVIDSISDPQKAVIYYRDGREEYLNIPGTENNMYHEVQEFLRLVSENQVEHPYLEGSRIKMKIMDQVRSQQGIYFPADQ